MRNRFADAADGNQLYFGLERIVYSGTGVQHTICTADFRKDVLSVSSITRHIGRAANSCIHHLLPMDAQSAYRTINTDGSQYTGLAYTFFSSSDIGSYGTCVIAFHFPDYSLHKAYNSMSDCNYKYPARLLSGRVLL